MLNSAPQSKKAVCALQLNYKLLPIHMEKSCRNEQMINYLSQLKAVSAISNMFKYNILAWEWIEVKLYVKWKYMLCSINAHTAFLLCEAVISVV